MANQKTPESVSGRMYSSGEILARQSELWAEANLGKFLGFGDRGDETNRN